MKTEMNSSGSSKWTRRHFVQASLSLPLAWAPWSNLFAGQDETKASLLKAVENGDLRTVQSLLDREPALLGLRDGRDRSLALVALQHRHSSIAQELVSRGHELDVVEAIAMRDWDRFDALAKPDPASIDELHPVGGTAIHAAALFGIGGSLFRVVRFGGDMNANPLGQEGVTPVFMALENPDLDAAVETVSAFLSNGASVNAPQRHGETLLHRAVRRQSEYLVRFLIRKGARVESRNDRGETPLDVARTLGKKEIIALLSDPSSVPRDLPRDHALGSRTVGDAQGAPYEGPDLQDIPQARINEMAGAAHNDFARLRALAKEEPRLVHGTSSLDEMVIEASAHMGRQDMVRYLLDRGAPLSLPTCLTMGLLDRAQEIVDDVPERIRERGAHDFALTFYPIFAGGDLGVAEWLVDNGVEIDSRCQMGMSGLHAAARSGMKELCAFWVDQGAEINALNYAKQTPWDMAMSRDQRSTATYLKSQGGVSGDSV